MLTDETMTETPTQPEPVLDGPVIVSPGDARRDRPVGTPRETAEAHASEAAEPGIDGEETVWEGHYSGKNFLGRMVLGGLLVLVWLTMAFRTWAAPTSTAAGPSGRPSSAFVVLLYWLNLGYRYLRAYRGHHYRLTTRRLFVTTGFFHRRVDQLELLRDQRCLHPAEHDRRLARHRQCGRDLLRTDPPEGATSWGSRTSAHHGPDLAPHAAGTG